MGYVVFLKPSLAITRRLITVKPHLCKLSFGAIKTTQRVRVVDRHNSVMQEDCSCIQVLVL